MKFTNKLKFLDELKGKKGAKAQSEKEIVLRELITLLESTED